MIKINKMKKKNLYGLKPDESVPVALLLSEMAKGIVFSPKQNTITLKSKLPPHAQMTEMFISHW